MLTDKAKEALLLFFVAVCTLMLLAVALAPLIGGL